MINRSAMKYGVVLCRISLLPFIPFAFGLPDATAHTSRQLGSALARGYERNIASLRDFRTFWRDPEQRIREYFLEGHRGVPGTERR